MPHTSSQAFLRELFLRSGDIPVASSLVTGSLPQQDWAGERHDGQSGNDLHAGLPAADLEPIIFLPESFSNPS